MPLAIILKGAIKNGFLKSPNLKFQFNFVGKLLGPKGNSLKRMQEETLTKETKQSKQQKENNVYEKNKTQNYFFFKYVFL